MRKIALALSCVVILGAGAFFWFIPHEVDRRYNHLGAGIDESPPASVPEWHHELRIVDLHADTLLWDRDLLVRARRGHVDLPRLQEGPVTLQVFSIVTKSPRGLNYTANAADAADDITLLALAQRWPPSTWGSLTERALYQIRRLQQAERDSRGALRLIRSRHDLRVFLEDRRQNPRLVAALLAIEGAHALEGDLSRLDTLAAEGVRVVAPAHLFDSEWSGSQQGVAKGGLTEKGRQWVGAMNEKKLIIDLAHVSSPAINEILALSSRPSMVSHTGVKAVCDNNRNLSDAQLKAVAERGGLIGIGFWEEVVCGRDLDSVARSLRHAVDVAGIDHVALGSDWDGFVSTPIDAARLGWLTAKLVQLGWTSSEIRQVMGENALRFFQDNLPD
ncbi:MAG: dipeptidase [Bdellovibrionaceae bacterium]|nr:dipeptidase [Pseudobdellovibrionaceae bacterium]MBX3033864.1 dipeptidase [Pseudobdellovibrionaceae bacterium]